MTTTLFSAWLHKSTKFLPIRRVEDLVNRGLVSSQLEKTTSIIKGEI
ncbi:hypothetical protein [Microcoleus sp. AT3-A2]